MTWTPDICIYHASCMDGFTAAWAVWRRFGELVAFIPAAYGDEPPEVAGQNVLIVDFSYKRPVLEQMVRTARSIIVLDHHKTAKQELIPFAHICGGSCEDVDRIFARIDRPKLPILTDFDEEHSGAALAWRFAHPGRPAPEIVNYVEDRDLWRFRLDDSREVNAYLGSLELDFHLWSDLAFRFLPDHKREGAAILAKQEKDISALLGASTRIMLIGGHKVPVANAPFMWASDAANILAEGNPFAATYFDRADGRRAFSLRSSSDGADVSAIAALYGGGGHEHAAGFTAAAGWEGETL